MDLDEFQEEIGGISKYQVVVILAVFWGSFGGGIATQSSIFILATPQHRCNIPFFDALECSLSEDEIQNATIPYEAQNNEYASCSRYNYNLTACDASCNTSCLSSQGQVGEIPCDYGYTYDDTYYILTTNSQWDLVCDRQYLYTIANVIFFLGFFVGSAIVGPISDWFGRKTAMLTMCTGLVLTSVGCAFSPTYEIFVFVRFLVGTFSVTNFIAFFTYACEISNTKWRTEACAYINLTSAVAHSVYPLLAYFIRDWHYLQICIGVLPAPFIIIYFFIPETPRWLLSNNKMKEARKVLNRYATSKGKILDDETWNLIVETERKKKYSTELKETNQDKDVAKTKVEDASKSTKKLAVWDLFRRPLMRLLSINVMICWFTVSMVFYGLALNGGNLSGDPYINTTLNAVVEIVAYICIYFADPFGRRPVLAISFVMAGLACLASMLCDIFAYGNQSLLTASTVLAIVGKFFASNCFAIVYAVTSEIFPTDVRTTGISMGSMAARVGSMLSPVILQLQTTIPWFTQTVFGVLSIISGFLSLLYPETASTDYMTSLDMAEEYYRENIPILKWCYGRKHEKEATEKIGADNKVFVNSDDVTIESKHYQETDFENATHF